MGALHLIFKESVGFLVFGVKKSVAGLRRERDKKLG